MCIIYIICSVCYVEVNTFLSFDIQNSNMFNMIINTHTVSMNIELQTHDKYGL